MKITKFGHCCLLIEEKGKRILTDPGNFSNLQDDVKNIDIILITHEHPDHIHIESLQKILTNSPKALIVTNTSTSKLLVPLNIPFEILEDESEKEFLGIQISGHGKLHEEVYSTIPRVQNTGFFISNKLFYPGDAFTLPGFNVDILALPVAGPWVKLSDSITYALKVKPRISFPVHDGMLISGGSAHALPNKILSENGIEFKILEIGKEYEF